ncbi:pyroglutamyl-peptidase I [Galbitalea sp. SE-J8]|uniref:pyroglutamyl-peptidase I n=1 Tax=Galbitalea sp. SE-J8 TaxID=3054952 RepID=UPI00259D1376|nr:pyroglutamyl-peptidase I [Galbitalea sp. SE-J8]MDM4763938.1 pyroglutamyl-peptidase I [Galbitalea sp. SE-J8]
MTLLVTGFEPFAGESVNASWLAVERLARGWDGDETLATALLPVEFARCGPALLDAIDGCDPRAIVCVGEAGRADGIRLERVAINLDDARIPDNAGARPVDEPIDPGGPAAYFSTLPLRAALDALQSAGIPARMSESAGTFACNHVFYELMAALAMRTDVVGGFVHVPYAPGQRGAVAGVPTLTTDVAAQALRIVLGAL